MCCRYLSIRDLVKVLKLPTRDSSEQWSRTAVTPIGHGRDCADNPNQSNQQRKSLIE